MTREETAGQDRQNPAEFWGGFPRRYYTGLKPFWRDFSYMISHRDQIREAMRSGTLPPDFRERLMLAVTEVNQCRYCQRFHIGQARQAGISTEEITHYLKGNIPEDIPEAQKLAVCYAQHWAESETDPDQEYLEQVQQVYGEEGLQAINIALRMIWMGNLLGNTLDYVIFRLSFGRWDGLTRPRTRGEETGSG